jgi:FAD:protein FMN transferase
MIYLPPIAIEVPSPIEGGYVFRDESILGTRMQVILVAQSFAIAHEAALAVRSEIDRLDTIFNSRRNHSELSVLNHSNLHRASAELFAVVAAAERWREITRGAFSGRLGRILDLWREALRPPSRMEMHELALSIRGAGVVLDPQARTIARPDVVQFALDGIAKGWIVDRAFDTAMNAYGIRGALIDIGGDIRCGGQVSDISGWRIDIPDPSLPQDNAPIVATTHLSQHAVATSGRGPRDRIVSGVTYSQTVSPFNGWPIDHGRSASVVARSAADADALATAMLVLPEAHATELAREHASATRITYADGNVISTTAPSQPIRIASVEPRPSVTQARTSWHEGWQALATFTAPRRQLIRDPHFRSPYMAMWITDADNQPIRTLLLVGRRADWQKDNFIWWTMNRPETKHLLAVRSMSTSGAGVYNVFWDGVDDQDKPVPAGKYVLHVETNRERGQHTYRSLALDLGTAVRFDQALPPTEEGGGLKVNFDHY